MVSHRHTLAHLVRARGLLDHPFADDALAWGRISRRLDKGDGRLVLARRAEDHSVGLDAPKLCRFQIAHDQHRLALQILLGRIVRTDACEQAQKKR